MFIVFEGLDNTGKSTQARLLKEYLESKGHRVCLTREPGGTPISEDIRKIILDPKNTTLIPETEALLYAASRIQHVEEVIMPMLLNDVIVICDRYVYSSIAYQAYGRQLGVEFIKSINKLAISVCMPNITFLLELSPEERSNRTVLLKDRIENENDEFYKRVAYGFDTIKAQTPGKIITINASQSIEDIANEINTKMDELLM